MVTIGDGNGTWMFDLRRLIEVPEPLEVVWAVTSVLWALLLVGAVVGGVLVGTAGRATRLQTVVFASPVLLFLLVSLVTIGDPRFRLGASPFTAVLIAMAVVWLIGRRLDLARHVI